MEKNEWNKASFSNQLDLLLEEMEKFAEENYIPIMDRKGIRILLQLLRVQKPKSILEIGSAIGYSAIRMAAALPDTNIVTIERDQDRFSKAVDFIKLADLHNRITILQGDALETETEEIFAHTYDSLFIDAAKGQYMRFFSKYAPLVKDGGVIYCDNMYMHGMVELKDEEIPKRHRTMIRKLKEFTEWILSHPAYDSELLPIGDGILIAVKKTAN